MAKKRFHFDVRYRGCGEEFVASWCGDIPPGITGVQESQKSVILVTQCSAREGLDARVAEGILTALLIEHDPLYILKKLGVSFALINQEGDGIEDES